MLETPVEFLREEKILPGIIFCNTCNVTKIDSRKFRVFSFDKNDEELRDSKSTLIPIWMKYRGNAKIPFSIFFLSKIGVN